MSGVRPLSSFAYQAFVSAGPCRTLGSLSSGKKTKMFSSRSYCDRGIHPRLHAGPWVFRWHDSQIVGPHKISARGARLAQAIRSLTTRCETPAPAVRSPSGRSRRGCTSRPVLRNRGTGHLPSRPYTYPAMNQSIPPPSLAFSPRMLQRLRGDQPPSPPELPCQRFWLCNRLVWEEKADRGCTSATLRWFRAPGCKRLSVKPQPRRPPGLEREYHCPLDSPSTEKCHPCDRQSNVIVVRAG